MSLSTVFAAEEMRELGFAAIGAGFLPLVSASSPTGSMDHPINMIYVLNKTDKMLFFSLNGIKTNFPLISGGYIFIDCTANKSNTAGLFYPAEKKIYVKQSPDGAPASGSVYASVFYGATV